MRFVLSLVTLFSPVSRAQELPWVSVRVCNRRWTDVFGRDIRLPSFARTPVNSLVAAPTLSRKFVKKSILEDPARGLLMNDTIIIRYQIELVVSTGGALARQITNERPSKSVVVPPPNLGAHMLRLFEDRLHTDVVFEVESNQLAAHKIILSARSPVFKALLTGPMLEGASLPRPFPSSSVSFLF